MFNASYVVSLLRCAKGVFWFSFLIHLSLKLPGFDLGQALLAFALIPFLSTMLISGWGEWVRNFDSGRQTMPLQAVEGVLLRFAWISTVGLLAIPLALLPSGFSLGFASMIFGCVGLTALLDLRCESMTATRGMFVHFSATLATLILALAMISAASSYWSLSAQSVVGIYLLALLVVVPLLIRKSIRKSGERSTRTLNQKTIAETGTVLLRNLDLPVAAYCLTEQETALYLMARLLVGVLGHIFIVLENRLVQPLSQALKENPNNEFIALSARANLGFMLIGGSIALSLVVFGPKFLQSIDPVFQGSWRTLFWLTLAAGAPAVFGATNMMMTVTALANQRTTIHWISLPFSLILIVFLAQNGPGQLALGVAISHLAVSCICAGYLGKLRGVWPGFTALMHQGLRLR